MLYQLHLSTLEHDLAHGISEGEFRAYKDILAGYRSIQHIEETYDVILGNYMEFEETVARLAVRQLASRHPIGRLEYFDPARRTCHRALSNLLSSARAFDEQSRETLARLFGKESEDFQQLKAAFSREYDASLGYRVMYELRNHAQHQGLAVTGVAFGARSLTTKPHDRRVATYAAPFIHMDELRESPKFKPAVLAQLEALMPHEPPEHHTVPVLPFVREYVAGLSNVIVSFREQMSEREAQWEREIRAGYRTFDVPMPPDGKYVFALEAIDGASLVEELWLGNRTADRIEQLREYNGSLKSLPERSIEQ